MKKLLIISLLIIGFGGIGFSAMKKTYSAQYAHRLEVCGAFSENYSTTMSSNQEHYTVHLTTTETVLGIRGGKCATKSEVYCQEAGQVVLKVECAFTQEQRVELAKLMTSATTDSGAANRLQNKMNNYIQNRPDVCKVTKYISDDDED